jgi:uncharacterized Zn-binding protein involved in type VI secretion
MAQHYTEEDVQRLLAESRNQSERPIKAVHVLATLGSRTRLGGEVVTATSGATVGDHPIARVGDIIRYPDGTESTIVSGAGNAMVAGDKPAAIIGGAAENGDTIISSLQKTFGFLEYADEDGIPGLLQPGYIPPPAKSLEETFAGRSNI